MDHRTVDEIRASTPYQAPHYHGPHVQWCWECPACQGHVLATYDEHATREEIAADARCLRCRRPHTAPGTGNNAQRRPARPPRSPHASDAALPPHILTRVAHHVRQLGAFNAGVASARRTDALYQGHGRYEWEYRVTHEAEADASLTALAQVEARAATHGISLEELYAHVDGKPAKEPWSAGAQTWRP